MMRQRLADNALHGGSSPEYRVSPEHRDGGSLDLDHALSALSVVLPATLLIGRDDPKRW